MSIYIPYVHPSCTEQEIKNVFNTLLIGNVERVDFVVKSGNNRNYFICFVHFKEWYDNQAAHNIIRRLENGKEARIVYKDPYYWVLFKNTKPVSNKHLMEEKLDCAFMMIEELQTTVFNMKKKIDLLEANSDNNCVSPVNPISIDFDREASTPPNIIFTSILSDTSPITPLEKPILKRSDIV